MPHESLLRRGQLRWMDISEIFVFTDFYVCCQKMAIKIKEIEPRTVPIVCLCTHVIVVHSMKLMIRSTTPFERGPRGMPVDLPLWFFNKYWVETTEQHTLTIAIVFIFLFVFGIHSQKAPHHQCCGSACCDLTQKPQKLELQSRALYLQSAAATKSTSASTPASTATANCNCDAGCGADSDYVRSG